MKTITKRKAKRIAKRPIRKKTVDIDRNIYYVGNEQEMLDKFVEVIVKIIKKEIGL